MLDNWIDLQYIKKLAWIHAVTYSLLFIYLQNYKANKLKIFINSSYWLWAMALILTIPVEESILQCAFVIVLPKSAPDYITHQP